MTLSIILSLLFTLPSAAFLNPNFGLHRSIHQPVRSTPFDNDYKTTGPLPNENKFTLSRTSAPLQSELTDLNLSLILGVVNDIPSVTILPPDDFGSPNPTLTLRSDQPNTNLVSDLEVNTLVWKCLGYRFSGAEIDWDNSNVFPNWRKKHPTPPDFVGMKRLYDKETDNPSLKSTQDLIKTIPLAYKQLLKEVFKPYGFNGFKLADLTPNLTRRAQCVNWLLWYRAEVFGKNMEQLKREKEGKEEEKKEKEEKEKNWTPPQINLT